MTTEHDWSEPAIERTTSHNFVRHRAVVVAASSMPINDPDRIDQH